MWSTSAFSHTSYFLTVIRKCKKLRNVNEFYLCKSLWLLNWDTSLTHGHTLIPITLITPTTLITPISPITRFPLSLLEEPRL